MVHDLKNQKSSTHPSLTKMSQTMSAKIWRKMGATWRREKKKNLTEGQIWIEYSSLIFSMQQTLWFKSSSCNQEVTGRSYCRFDPYECQYPSNSKLFTQCKQVWVHSRVSYCKKSCKGKDDKSWRARCVMLYSQSWARKIITHNSLFSSTIVRRIHMFSVGLQRIH